MEFEEFARSLEQPLPWKAVPQVWAARSLGRVRRLRLFFLRGAQRWRRGYSEEDTWSFDHFLCGVIAGGVARMRERGLGHPASMSPEEWDAVLDQIEDGFRAAQKGPWEMSEANWQSWRVAIDLFSKHYFDLWD